MTPTQQQMSQPQDRQWTDRLRLRLVVHHGASAELVEEVLGEVHQACADSGRPAADLFGVPDAYAAEVVDARLAQQVPATAGPAGRDLAPTSQIMLLGGGMGLLLLCVALGLADGWTVTVRSVDLVLAAAATAAAAAGTAAVRARFNGRLSRAARLWVIGAGVLVGGAGVAMTVDPATAAVAALPLAVPAGLGAVAVLVALLLPTATARRPEVQQGPDDWFLRLEGLLRGRWSVPRRQAQQLTEDARTYWASSGAPHPHDEFGSPQGYAFELAARSAVAPTARRRAWLFTGLTLAFPAAALLLPDPATGLLALVAAATLVAGTLAALAWRAAREAAAAV